MSAFQSLSYQELRQCAIESLRSAESTRADVLLIETRGDQAILKDYSGSNKGFRWFIAPLLVYREIRSLRALDGVPGVPGFIRKLSARTFLIEFIPARQIGLTREGIDWVQFIPRIEALIHALHEKGVVHGDLRNTTNILATAQQRPVFVDFVSAVHRGHRFNVFSLILFKLCQPIDHGAVFKLKEKYAPQLITPAEHLWHTNPGRIEAAARWLSARIRNLVQLIFP